VEEVGRLGRRLHAPLLDVRSSADASLDDGSRAGDNQGVPPELRGDCRRHCVPPW
jgi:hypothetical protein